MSPGKLPPISGVILAGGMGRRMGGVDKGLQIHAGQPLVAHVIARLAPQVSDLAINANRHATDYARYGLPVFADLDLGLEDYPGPLAGLLSALHHAREALVLTVPCDSPHLPLDLAARLYAGLQASAAELAVARCAERLHPVFCLARRSLAPALATALANGERRFARWCAAQRLTEVGFDDQAAAFANFNTLADLGH